MECWVATVVDVAVPAMVAVVATGDSMVGCGMVAGMVGCQIVLGFGWVGMAGGLTCICPCLCLWGSCHSGVVWWLVGTRCR